MENTLKLLTELPPWLAVVCALIAIGALWGMRSTYRRINGYAAGMTARLESIEMKCISRQASCNDHLNDVLEMRRKLFMEITDAKFDAYSKLLTSKFDGLMELIKSERIHCVSQAKESSKHGK